MANLTLTEIWIYPVKSFGGIRVKSAKLFQKGLEFDRRWMLIDEHNQFMTQRVFPKMAIFKLSMVGSQFSIHFKNESVSLPAQSENTKSIHATIWNDEVEVNEVSDELSRWISARLEINCKLVSFPEEKRRPVDLNFQINQEQVSLADAFPCLIIGEQSLAELNTRLETPVPMNRFRPNFVFSGGNAFDEDSWKQFSIGKNKFAVVKPCARCVLTTVDQLTGEKGIEPLATLSTFRKKENKVLFGQNLIALKYEEVFEGDEIILE
ncbi:MAG: MOSC domain-containing protein [Bacteroidetes bacterium]|nr:MOSC domain-containing protein [Bacteroidota bacterium]